MVIIYGVEENDYYRRDLKDKGKGFMGGIIIV